MTIIEAFVTIGALTFVVSMWLASERTHAKTELLLEQIRNAVLIDDPVDLVPTDEGDEDEEPATFNVKLMEGGRLPERKTEGAAGIDCYVRGDHTIAPFQVAKVPLGFACEIPRNHVGIVVLRSSTAEGGRLDMPGGLGAIDSDFRGELRATVRTGVAEQRIASGERIAQLIIVPVAFLEPNAVDKLSETARGEGGYGSTGAT